MLHKIADDFKANAGKPRPGIAAQVDETELAKQVEKDEKELAELEKQVKSLGFMSGLGFRFMFTTSTTKNSRSSKSR
jgi:uncharacterized protein YbaP (TraB family)